jgi:hypothetical protein
MTKAARLPRKVETPGGMLGFTGDLSDGR